MHLMDRMRAHRPCSAQEAKRGGWRVRTTHGGTSVRCACDWLCWRPQEDPTHETRLDH
jgi:hypothetical protein